MSRTPLLPDPVFETLRPLSALRTVAVVHQAMGIARHLKPLPPGERERVARARAEVAGDDETPLARDIIGEIERAAGAPLAAVDDAAVERYLGELADYALERMRTEYRPNPQRGRERLREMRQALSF